MIERIDLNRFKSPSVFIILGTVGLILFTLSLIVEVRIIFEYPAYGDVTGVVRGLWRLILGIATLGSFALAIHNYRRDDDSSGPPTQFSVRGRNHDIDFHVHIGGPDESSEPAQRREEGGEDDEKLRPDAESGDEETADSDEHQRES